MSKQAPKSLAQWRKELDPGELTPSTIRTEEGRIVETFDEAACESYDARHRIASRLPLAAAALEVPAAKVLSLFDRGLTFHLREDDGLEPFVRLATQRGQEWTTAFLTGLLRKRWATQTANALISRLVVALDLPLPDSSAYLIGWSGTMPAPGERWQDHFLAACAIPGSFDNSFDSREERVARIREAATKLRRTEPTDDTALLDALLSVIERGERPGPQREALAWIEGLDLDPT
ncbi:hypothetical protein, partial [Arachnia propionica]